MAFSSNLAAPFVRSLLVNGSRAYVRPATVAPLFFSRPASRPLHTTSIRRDAVKLEPMFDRVLVKKVEAETQTKGGIMLPENQTKTHNGTVVAVGTGARSREGDFYKPVLKVGDKVMLPEYGGNKVDINGETHFVYRESDIIGRWNS